MNIQELVILGLLREFPRHGYEIKKTVKKVLVLYAPLERESVYYSLRILEKKGLVKKESAQSGKRPTKYVYKITPEGEKYLRRLLLRNINKLQRPFINLDLTLYFFAFLKEDKEEVIRRFRLRLRILERVKHWLKAKMHTFTPQEEYQKVILEHNLKLATAEVNFTRSFLERLAD